MPIRTLALSLLVLAAAAGWTARASAATPCGDLARFTAPHVTILRAQVADSGRFEDRGRVFAGLPAFCRVEGVSSPGPGSRIGFEVWLPLEGWSRRLHMVGNGAYSSHIYYAQMAARIRARDVAVATDTGHTGSDLAFGFDDPQAIRVWAHLAVHESVVAAKAVARAYYGAAPRWSYFSGCSTGGMQALSEVQAYPDDFDGVIAGDPGNDRTNLTLAFLWDFERNHRQGDAQRPIVTVSKLLMVNRAVVRACDRLDGVADGVISDPRRCRFDLESLRCKAGPAADCLTGEEIGVFRAIYAGPRDARTGRSVYPGFTFGSEGVVVEPGQALPGWSEYWADPHHPDQPDRLDVLRRWALHDPAWDWRSFDWGQDIDRVRASLSPLLDSTNPDLSAFRARGGKLILFMGWQDPVGAAADIIDYYDQVVARAGGGDPDRRLAETQAYARLFMVPGMGHCAGGPGATHFSTATRDSTPPVSDARHDMAVALEDWVEQGRAPDTIIATRYKMSSPDGGVAFQRPLCPYPQAAAYVGGDPNQAGSFKCAPPR